jgi:hypothetical protein
VDRVFGAVCPSPNIEFEVSGLHGDVLVRQLCGRDGGGGGGGSPGAQRIEPLSPERLSGLSTCPVGGNFNALASAIPVVMEATASAAELPDELLTPPCSRYNGLRPRRTQIKRKKK